MATKTLDAAVFDRPLTRTLARSLGGTLENGQITGIPAAIANAILGARNAGAATTNRDTGDHLGQTGTKIRNAHQKLPAEEHEHYRKGVLSILGDIFGNGGEVRIDMDDAEVQNQTLVQRLGLNTRAGRMKLAAGLALGGLALYYGMNGSSNCENTIAQLAENTDKLNKANAEVSTLKDSLKTAQQTAEAATKYTKARDALLHGTCRLGQARTEESIAAKATAFFQGCKENPIFNSATQAIVNAPKK